MGSSYSSTDLFSGKFVCECCGSFFGTKVWHSNSPHRRTIYQCNKKFQNKYETPYLTKEFIEERFIIAYNKTMLDRDALIEDTKEGIALMRLQGDS